MPKVETDRSGLSPPLPLVFGLLTLVLVCLSRAVLNDGDTFTHVAAGGWMLEHGSVLRQDPFTATFAGAPWQAHEWLAEVLLAAAYRGAGLAGVTLLTAAAAAATFGLLARHVGRWCGWRETLLLTAAGLLCVIPSVLARPHILALPLMEVWVAGLLVARSERRAPGWGLLAAMVAWANLHGGFAFGIAIAAAMALEATLEHARDAERSAGGVRRWWVFVAGSVGAALLTPQGWDGLLFPLRLLGLDSLRLIQEWAPTDFREQRGIEAVIVALVVLLGTGRVKLPWFRLLLLAGLLHLAIEHARHSVLFGIVGALLLAEPVGRAFAGPIRVAAGSRWAWFGGPAIAAAMLLRLATPLPDQDSRVAPVSAMSQLPLAVVGTPVLNSTLFGGYLEMAGLRPFIDGRVELFGDAFVREFMALSQAELPGGSRLAQAVERYGIGWALLAVGDPLIAGFDGLAGWRRQYADGVAVVFVRG